MSFTTRSIERVAKGTATSDGAGVDAGHERLLGTLHQAQAGLGPGLGGTRMWPYASDEEAITDVLRLSKGMICSSS